MLLKMGKGSGMNTNRTTKATRRSIIFTGVLIILLAGFPVGGALYANTASDNLEKPLLGATVVTFEYDPVPDLGAPSEIVVSVGHGGGGIDSSPLDTWNPNYGGPSPYPTAPVIKTPTPVVVINSSAPRYNDVIITNGQATVVSDSDEDGEDGDKSDEGDEGDDAKSETDSDKEDSSKVADNTKNENDDADKDDDAEDSTTIGDGEVPLADGESTNGVNPALAWQLAPIPVVVLGIVLLVYSLSAKKAKEKRKKQEADAQKE
jgi:hypothetical protein